ncbi:Component of a membrane-bound complex containing the Tor2p kinase [Coemansia sp. RSA 2598]|nr:Component of a membrane-bound complex containing the Tor2p kinase [Coemansia sp. RSA 2598]
MALLQDPTFLIYQLRVSFLRSNDPAGERILTFDDLVVPPQSAGSIQRARQGSIPSPMAPGGRRKTSASEIRRQVAQNAQANPYIMACGYYPEIDGAHSPELEHGDDLLYSASAFPSARPTPRLALMGGEGRAVDVSSQPPLPSARYPDGSGPTGRAKRTNRNAKVAPTREGREEVVGLGVVPQHPEILRDYAAEAPSFDQSVQPPSLRRSLDTVRPRPLPMVAEAADSGSLSDSGQMAPGPTAIPPRRSLDTIHAGPQDRSRLAQVLPVQAAAAELAVAATARNADAGGETVRGGRRQGHMQSNSVATIRLQRPSDMKRKGSSRDAIALGIDFDVTTMFDTKATGSSKSSSDSARSQDAAQQPAGRDSPSRKASTLRAKRSDASFKIPLSNLREDRAAQLQAQSQAPALKRSATLPTKRHHVVLSGQRSRWANAYAAGVKVPPPQVTSQASGWVGGAPETSWDQSSSEEEEGDESGAGGGRRQRRGIGTHTWYGPRTSIRPVSMFPPPRAGTGAPYHAPPVPVLFGADDSDDDIDLEGDEGSSRTPALIGLPGFGNGLQRPLAPSPGPASPSVRSRSSSIGSVRSRGNSISGIAADVARPPRRSSRLAQRASTLATSVPASSPLAISASNSSSTQVPSAVSAAKYSHLAQEGAIASRPRGISDPRGNSASSPSALPNSAEAASVDSKAMARDVLLRKGGTAKYQTTSSAAPLSPVSAPSLQASASSAADTAAPVAAYVPPSPPKKSGLAALLSSKVEVRYNPFAEEFGTIGMAQSAGGSGMPFALKVFVFYSDGSGAKSQVLDVRVRSTATVEQAIGFVLHQYIEEGRSPALSPDVQDVVQWVLHIADDGEVDDDFPVLDRTRQVAKFAFDEFALCLATPEQVKLNESIRVRQGRPPRMSRPQSLLPPQTPSAAQTSAGNQDRGAADTKVGIDASSSTELRYRITPRKQLSAVVLQQSRAAIASTAGIFAGTSLLAAHAGTLPPLNSIGAPVLASLSMLGESRFLRIRILGDHKAADALHSTTVEIDSDATVGAALAQVRRKKPFSEDDYVLGVIEGSRFVVCNPDLGISQIPDGVELCLQKIGAPLPPPESLAIYEKRWSEEPARAADAGTAAAASSGLVNEDAPPNSHYYTFRVVRRAQMFARHDRLLVIDGEVVTLMPADHRTESAKTLTFHISNIVCKRNQRSPKKIRLMVTRRTNGGEKSVDLEAATDDDATHICTILARMHKVYVANNGGAI